MYFGQYGKIVKIVVNRHHGGGNSGKPSASAYVTFANEDGARSCIRAVDGCSLAGRTLRYATDPVVVVACRSSPTWLLL